MLDSFARLESAGNSRSGTLLEIYHSGRPLAFELDSDFIKQIFSTDDLETYLFTAGVAADPDLFSMAHNGRPLAVSSTDDILRGLSAGSTLSLHGIQRRWPAAGRFASEVGEYFGSHVVVNVFIALSGGQAYPLHYDTQDLFILQAEGEKQWRVFRKWEVSDDPSVSIDHLGPPIIETKLSSGRCLYVPRGHYHSVSAADCGSTHTALGIHPVRIGDLGTRLLSPRRGLTTADQPISVQDLGGIGRELESLAQEIKQFALCGDAGEHVLQLLRWDLSRQNPLPGNYLNTVRKIDSAGAGTLFRRRPGVRFRCVLDGDRLFLLAHDFALPFPRKIEPAVRALLTKTHFSSTDFSQALTIEAALHLLKRLAVGGCLEIVPDE
ncbi:JmjC domain-containing protein [Bosea vaviloviae]|uniref:JmjC domain-containing protein n=1 Tax=Bosea vaviloviae TaxID=1526658 RepID=UPI0009F6216A|nr:cupin domain-containing protein [Bosea vaviloviae]